VSLYAQDNTFLDFEFAEFSSTVRSNNEITVTFSDIPSGTYALSAIHDEDGNGKLKQWFWIGPPKEGVASSSRGDGIPSFESAQFDFQSDSLSITLEMKYLGSN